LTYRNSVAIDGIIRNQLDRCATGCNTQKVFELLYFNIKEWTSSNYEDIVAHYHKVQSQQVVVAVRLATNQVTKLPLQPELFLVEHNLLYQTGLKKAQHIYCVYKTIGIRVSWNNI
jgi:hypothetical protein